MIVSVHITPKGRDGIYKLSTLYIVKINTLSPFRDQVFFFPIDLQRRVEELSLEEIQRLYFLSKA